VNTDTFYAATSALCFTLLGFWWVVVQFRHREMTATPTARRFAFLVSLYFLVPGLVSLASLAAGSGPLWRWVFASAGIAGILSVLAAMRYASASGTIRTLARWSWIALPFYALLTIFALAPNLARENLALEPLQVEGFVLIAIMFLGVVFAWLLFTEPMEAADGEAVPGAGG
jgi:hypothetical protein